MSRLAKKLQDEDLAPLGELESRASVSQSGTSRSLWLLAF